MAPNWPATAVVNSSMSEVSPMSQRRLSISTGPLPAASFAVSARPASSTSHKARFAPSRANRIAPARPWPLAAPVMITVLPSSAPDIGVSFTSAAGRRRRLAGGDGPLGGPQADSALGAAVDRYRRLLLIAVAPHRVPDDRAPALLVDLEEVGHQQVADGVPLAAVGVDPQGRLSHGRPPGPAPGPPRYRAGT